MPGPSTLIKKKTAVIAMDYQIDMLGAFPADFQTQLTARYFYTQGRRNTGAGN